MENKITVDWTEFKNFCITNKKWVIICACALVIFTILCASDPIPIAVRNDCANVTLKYDGTIFSFYRTPFCTYYLADGSNPMDVTVYYLNRMPEDFLTAFNEERIDTADMDRLGIEYIVRPR